MKNRISLKKQLTGAAYGLVAGLAFAFFAWGLDGIQLAQANGAYSWVKFLPGLLVCLAVGCLVGWLTVFIDKVWISIPAWLAMGYLFARLVFWLPIRVAPQVIKIFNPAMGEFLQYPYYQGFNQIRGFVFVTLAIVAVISGLLENILIDQALFSSGKMAIAVPLVVCILAFSLAGNAVDSVFNKNLREPIQKVDEMLQFAYENQGKEVPKDLARQKRLSASNNIQAYLNLNRKLILSNYDESMGQVDVLVDFEGRWVKCTTVYNQVTYCTPVFETPWNMISRPFKLAQYANQVGIITRTRVDGRCIW